jgi:hypothetical protein
VEQPAGVERVRDEPDLETAVTKRLEERHRRRSELARRCPGGVLGLEEATELVLGWLEPELAEELAHEARILELLERPGHPEERLVPLPEVRGDRVRGREPVAPDRLEPGPLPRRDELGVVREPHQGVAPVEEDRPNHAG